jgi:RimJ/RimL family protein N-acetyltransferase
MVDIVTERLRLRLFQPAGLPAFVAYRSVAKVARYQSWDTTYSMVDAEQFSPHKKASSSAHEERGCSWQRSTD